MKYFYSRINKLISVARYTLQFTLLVFISSLAIAEVDKINVISQELHSNEKQLNHITTNLAKLYSINKIIILQISEEKDVLDLLIEQENEFPIRKTMRCIEGINKRLDKLKTIQTKINDSKKVLKDLQIKQIILKQSLKLIIKKKEQALKKQRIKISSQREKVNELINIEQDLNIQTLIKDLMEKQEVQ